MKKKKKIIVLSIVATILLVTIFIASYALWNKTFKQTGENIITSLDCIDIDFIDGNAITLTDTFPISDKEGTLISPYTFEVSNKCDEWVKLDINVESLNIEEKSLPDEYIKVNLQTKGGTISNTTLTPSLQTQTTLNDAKNAYNLYVDNLKPKGTYKYELRLWMDESVPYTEASTNAFFEGKITVIARATTDPYAVTGSLKPTFGDEDSLPSGAFWDYREDINKVVFENELKPISKAAYSFDISAIEDKSVMSYLVDDGDGYTLYIQGDGGVDLNPNSSYLFANFTNLKTIEGLKNVNTKNVEDMSYMFANCSKLSDMTFQYFDLSKTQSTKGMFENCTNISIIDFSDLEAPFLEDMSYMFANCQKARTINLEGLSSQAVKNMEKTFYKTLSLQDINLNGINSSEMENMNLAFANCSNLENVKLGTFTFVPGATATTMFLNSTNITNLDLTKLNTTGISDFSNFFKGLSKVKELDLSSFNTSSATNMSNMFSDMSSLSSLDLSNFDTENVTDMSYMFSGMSSLSSLDLSNFDTGKVTTMPSMFIGTSSLSSIDLSSFNTENVTDMSYMFNNNLKNSTLDISNFNTSKVENMKYMFYKLGYDAGGNFNLVLGRDFKTSKVTDMSYMFAYCANQTDNYSLVLGENFDTSNLTNARYMFQYFGNKSNNTSLNIDGAFKTNNLVSTSNMFDHTGYSSTNFEFNLGDSFNTSKVTDMSYMFDYLGSSSKYFTANIGSGFDTSNVTNMKYMFRYAFSGDSGITNSFNLTKPFNTTNTNDFSYMFNYSYLKFDISDFVIPVGANLDSFAYRSNNLYGNIFIDFGSLSSYEWAFRAISKVTFPKITVDYISSTQSSLDTAISSFGNYSLIKKGVLRDATELGYHQITLPSDITANKTMARKNEKVALFYISKDKTVTSFKVNGEYIEGNEFIMSDSDVTITDITYKDGFVVESEHNPYPNSQNNVVYYENTFEGAKSITVELTYQTESTNYDWVYLYSEASTIYGGSNNKYGGTTKTTITVTLPSNYIKIVFKTDGSGNNYYGFKAVITPNY